MAKIKKKVKTGRGYKIVYDCDYCGNNVEANLSDYKTSNRHYCCKNCYQKDRLEGNIITRKKSKKTKRYTKKEKDFYNIYGKYPTNYELEQYKEIKKYHEEMQQMQKTEIV